MVKKKKNKKKTTMNPVQPPTHSVSNQVQSEELSAVVRPEDPNTLTVTIPIHAVPTELYNKIVRENETLRREISRYRMENTSLISERDRMSLTIKELQEENEKLRKELSDIKEKVQKLEIDLSDEKIKTNKLESDMAELKNNKIKNQLLAAAVEILEKEEVKKTIDPLVWKRLKKPRNESAHYLYESADDKLTEDEKLERYKLFRDVYEKHKDLLILDRKNTDSNNTLINMLITVIDKKLHGSYIDETSDSYTDSKEYYWTGCM